MGVRGAGVRGAMAGLEIEGEVSERPDALRAVGARRALFIRLRDSLPEEAEAPVVGGPNTPR